MGGTAFSDFHHGLLAKIRGPAFYQETVVTDAQARDWVQRVEHALQFGEDLLRRLRKAL